MWLYGEDQEIWLGFDGPSGYCEGQVKGSCVRDRMVVKQEQGLSIDGHKSNGEEQAMLRLMNQEGHVITWSGSYHYRIIKPCVDLGY